VCHGADVEAADSKAISVMLRDRAVTNVGFLEYVLHATPIMAQKRKEDCA